MQSILAFVFVIGVLVFIHELGHFLAARRVGIRVLTFSLGFGPKLLKYQRGDTEYCVCALPLGIDAWARGFSTEAIRRVESSKRQ